MPEVLKRRQPKAPTHQFDCKGCGSTLRAEKGEGRFVDDPRDGNYVEIICPICATPTNLAASLLK